MRYCNGIAPGLELLHSKSGIRESSETEGGKTMRPILSMLKTDWKMCFLFLSMVVCVCLIIFMMITLAKII